jgi:hypothetical protein
MSKKNIILQEEIDRINKIMKNARLINEGFYLEDDDEYMGPETDAYDDSDVPAEEPAPAPQEGDAPKEDSAASLGSDFVNKIRAITLDGMKQLNNTPDDPKFQALLKIFNICNKAVDDQKEQQQPQPQNVQ